MYYIYIYIYIYISKTWRPEWKYRLLNSVAFLIFLKILFFYASLSISAILLLFFISTLAALSSFLEVNVCVEYADIFCTHTLNYRWFFGVLSTQQIKLVTGGRQQQEASRLIIIIIIVRGRGERNREREREREKGSEDDRRSSAQEEEVHQ